MQPMVVVVGIRLDLKNPQQAAVAVCKKNFPSGYCMFA